MIYRRVDDEFLDPLQFRADSMLGCPGLLNAARAGNVTIANAVGNGVADDKLVYTYVPDLIRYYLARGADPRATSTPGGSKTPARLEEVLDRLDELVRQAGRRLRRQGPRDRAAARAADELDELRRRINADPRGWIAQPVVQLSTIPTLVDDGCGRGTSTCGRSRSTTATDVWVLPGGLTRVALPEGELVVNSSQGGGSKDTWVLGGADARPAGAAARPAARSSSRGRAGRPAATSPTVGPGASARIAGHSSSSSSNSSDAAGGDAVLSRIAESLFWIGRYIERADGTARILDVHLQLLLEDPWIDEDVACRSLLSVMGATAARRTGRPQRRARPARRRPRQPGSIADSLAAARENARRAREIVSTEMWEALNTTWTAMPRRRRQATSVHEFFALGARARRARRRHRRRDDEPRRGLALPHPRPQHRARRHDGAAARDAAPSTRRSVVDAPAAVVRRLRGVPAHLPRRADAATPPSSCCSTGCSRGRSFAALETAEECLEAIEPSAARVGVADEARRVLGRAAPSSSTARCRPARRPARRDGAHPARLLRGEQRGVASLLPAQRRDRVVLGGRVVTTVDATPVSGPQRLAIVHNTGFSYPAEAVASYNEARMTPLTTPVQTVLDARIEVEPAAATYRYWDYWGTLVTAFDVRVPHRRLTVTARSVVETLAYVDDGAAVGWEELRHPLRSRPVRRAARATVAHRAR